MEKQIELKEEVLLVGFDYITKSYKFADGRIMSKYDYDNGVWINSPYTKEDYYSTVLIGNQYFIERQEQIVKTIKKAKEFQRNQRLKLIRKKELEIKLLKGETKCLNLKK